MTQYEYKVVRIAGGQRMTEDMLNQLGNEGYRLANVTPTGHEWTFVKDKPVTRTRKATPKKD
ncbi:DUF4177 domain-containing protein [Streptomyces sp. B1I3]|uniref:DUF4177 domain-containing protein n=1 Tax=Streptomyces sp. B1I3 TaxID=3042264 RepID=UPI00278276CF|nr:hypothetical protein [Streptomyces sp. B1I3]